MKEGASNRGGAGACRRYSSSTLVSRRSPRLAMPSARSIAGLALACRHPVEVREDQQVLLDRERDVEVVELRHHAHLRARLLGVLGQPEAEHLELALVGDHLRRQRLHRRRLAGAVRPEQADAACRTGTSRSRPSTAVSDPNRLTTPRSLIAAFSGSDPMPVQCRGRPERGRELIAAPRNSAPPAGFGRDPPPLSWTTAGHKSIGNPGGRQEKRPKPAPPAEPAASLAPRST